MGWHFAKAIHSRSSQVVLRIGPLEANRREAYLGQQQQGRLGAGARLGAGSGYRSEVGAMHWHRSSAAGPSLDLTYLVESLIVNLIL